MSISPALADYHSYPIVLSSSAWSRTVYLQNPARVHEMSQRLATVVQAAWQELKERPEATYLNFSVLQKQAAGQARDLIALTLTVGRDIADLPFIQIDLHADSAQTAVC